LAVPECGAACKLHDITGAAMAALDTCQYQTICTPSRRAARAATMECAW